MQGEIFIYSLKCSDPGAVENRLDEFCNKPRKITWSLSG